MKWAEQAIKNIAQEKISHVNWENALSEAFAGLIACSPGEVMCITGPSRIGKSELVDEVAELIAGKPRKRAKKHYMPVVKVFAKNNGPNGTFSTKAFAKRTLKAINHPFYSNFLDSDTLDVHKIGHLSRITEDTYTDAFENAIKALGTRYLIIDESQHVGYAQSRIRDAAAIYDSWKCLAEDNNLILVLSGAYPQAKV